VLAGLGAPLSATTMFATATAAVPSAERAAPGSGSARPEDDSRRTSAPAQGGVEGASAEQPATVLPWSPPPGSDGNRTPVFVLAGLLVLLGFGLRALRATRT
jgi:hypothetical protein